MMPPFCLLFCFLIYCLHQLFHSLQRKLEFLNLFHHFTAIHLKFKTTVCVWKNKTTEDLHYTVSPGKIKLAAPLVVKHATFPPELWWIRRWSHVTHRCPSRTHQTAHHQEIMTEFGWTRTGLTVPTQVMVHNIMKPQRSLLWFWH